MTEVLLARRSKVERPLSDIDLSESTDRNRCTAAFEPHSGVALPSASRGQNDDTTTYLVASEPALLYCKYVQ